MRFVAIPADQVRPSIRTARQRRRVIGSRKKAAICADSSKGFVAEPQRWIVERTIAWLGNYWRLTVRYDRSLTIYRGFFHIACFMIVLRRVLK